MIKFSKIPLFLIVVCLQICQFTIYAEDYQYQYFNNEKDKYVPFSDYIPKVRLHYKTVPHYLEDYYELYGMKQYYNENSLRKNIERLKTALRCKFRHPSEALIKINTEEEYLKYRRLMFMHINILIMRNHMKIASRYDKRKIYFYNLDFAKEIDESLDIAESLYKKAIPYWKKAKDYAKSASRIKLTTDLGFIESERFSIINNDLNYGKIIDDHLKRINRNRKILNKTLASQK
ncbi:MAG: hypothetical protein SVR08_18245 [Spirochaetota bacterium]|nr:hypothetical protein [Spirochaetota bacterium]